jgi:hypothetical protein
MTTSQPAVNFSNMPFTSASSTSNLAISPLLSFSCAACSPLEGAEQQMIEAEQKIHLVETGD